MCSHIVDETSEQFDLLSCWVMCSGMLASISPVSLLSDMMHTYLLRLNTSHRNFCCAETSPCATTQKSTLGDVHLPRMVQETEAFQFTTCSISLIMHCTVYPLAWQELGYKPQMRLDEGIQRFCDWFKRYYDLHDGSTNQAAAADWAYNPL